MHTTAVIAANHKHRLTPITLTEVNLEGLQIRNPHRLFEKHQAGIPIKTHGAYKTRQGNFYFRGYIGCQFTTKAKVKIFKTKKGQIYIVVNKKAILI